MGQSARRRQGEKWSDSGHIMKVEGTGFADRLGISIRKKLRIWPEQQGYNYHSLRWERLGSRRVQESGFGQINYGMSIRYPRRDVR